MIAFSLEMKEENKSLESIVDRYFEGKEGGVLFSKVKEKYADYLVAGNPSDQPFLYMKLVPIKTEADRNLAASIIPTAYFKPEVLEEMVEFIEGN